MIFFMNTFILSKLARPTPLDVSNKNMTSVASTLLHTGESLEKEGIGKVNNTTYVVVVSIR